MDNMLSLDFMDTVNAYDDYITGIYGNNNIVYMDNAGSKLGMYQKSDIILVYNGLGEMIISCERLNRSDYSPLKFFFMKLKYRFKKARGTKCYTIRHDTIDIIHFKMWWWNWAHNLL